MEAGVIAKYHSLKNVSVEGSPTVCDLRSSSLSHTNFPPLIISDRRQWEGLGTRPHKHRTGNSCKVNLHVLKELQQLLKRHESNLQGQNRDDDSMGS